MVDGRFEKVEGTDFELAVRARAAGHGLRRPASATGLLEQLGVELDERGNVARDERFATNVDGVFVVRRHGPGPEPHRVGDRRGPLVRGGRRRVADGRDRAAGADRAGRPPADLTPTATPRAGVEHARLPRVEGAGRRSRAAAFGNRARPTVRNLQPEADRVGPIAGAVADALWRSAAVRIDSRGGGRFDIGSGVGVGSRVVLTNAHLTDDPVTLRHAP